MHVWAWLSHTLRHGVLKVAGHVRLQDAFWVEQFDTHASEDASANLNLLALIAPSFANAVPRSAHRTAAAKVNFMWTSLTLMSKIMFTLD